MTLPKWSGMLVSGTDITPDAAAIVIVRCQDFFWSTNCKDVARRYGRLAGIEPDEYACPTGQADYERALSKYGCLDIAEELALDSRVLSAWIGGPHGWIDWDGTVGCQTYNIGKYPDADDILKGWQSIAAAFPDLDLTCQLLDREIIESGHLVAAQFRVQGGQAYREAPAKDLVAEPKETPFNSWPLGPGREVGCSEELWRHALSLAAAAESPYRWCDE